VHSNKGKFLVPVAIIMAATVIAVGFVLSRTEPQLAKPEPKVLLIEAAKVVKEDLKISVRTQGTVTPRTTTSIVAEVSGVITKVSPRFKTGGFFKAGEVLLQIDQRDYITHLRRAEAAVASAKSKLASEQGQAEVAYQDWVKYKSNVKRSQAATDLALRKPQLADAQAGLDAAMADLDHAKDQLDRTVIGAPYDGLVNAKRVDIGQYVTSGVVLAETFAVDVAELRLAVPESKLNYLHLPSLADDPHKVKPSVDLYASIGDEQHQWQAQLVRTEGVFDQRSRVLFAVAQISDPYGLNSPQKQVLRIGTFVDARIEGKVIPNLVKLPRHILRAGNQIWVIDAKQRLQNRRIKILRTQGEYMYVTAGLTEGEMVSLSNISDTIAGTNVRVSTVKPTNEQDSQSPQPMPEAPNESNINIAPVDMPMVPEESSTIIEDPEGQAA
jgi:RND family efflux transporter MFP subunit